MFPLYKPTIEELTKFLGNKKQDHVLELMFSCCRCNIIRTNKGNFIKFEFGFPPNTYEIEICRYKFINRTFFVIVYDLELIKLIRPTTSNQLVQFHTILQKNYCSIRDIKYIKNKHAKFIIYE